MDNIDMESIKTLYEFYMAHRELKYTEDIPIEAVIPVIQDATMQTDSV